MSSKTTKKAKTTVPKVPEPIVTRTKSAQQKRLLRNKNKKTEKPKLTKKDTKSTKTNKSVICSKEALHKSPEKDLVEVVDQVEYYPDKLKRDICAKKIMLKPKHNFKVIATTNKRKLATPQKGGKSPPPSKKPLTNRSLLKAASRGNPRACSSPDVSMQDMVRMIDETRSLSDEDFMEILTCPSPVWWEDPPDGRYDEDSIITISSDPEDTDKSNETNSSRNSPINTNKNLAPPEQSTEQTNVIREKFNKKKIKLENVLGNIKNKTIKKPDEIKKNLVKNNEFDRNRKLSDSEGDISDLSFNEEEILKNLESMEIPVEKPEDIETDYNEMKQEMDTDLKQIKEEKTTENDNVIKKEKEEILPTLTQKPEIKNEFSEKSPISTHIDASLEGTNSNTILKNEENDIVDSCTKPDVDIIKDSKSLLDVIPSSNCEIKNSTINEQINKIPNSNMDKNDDVLPAKKTNDLSEYITIYKIIPDKNKGDKNPQNELKSTEDNNSNKIKIDTSGGKLNDFFKQCKNNKRLKKNETSIPAVSATAVNEETTDTQENITKIIDPEDEKSRIQPCDYCVKKIENGTTDFSCEKCEMAPILPCNLCNFVADTKEVYRKHVSSCKDVARISWSHNYVLNQT